MQTTKADARMFARSKVLEHHANHCGCGASKDCALYDGDVRIATYVLLKFVETMRSENEWPCERADCKAVSAFAADQLRSEKGTA